VAQTKREFLHLAWPFISLLQVIVDIFGMWVEHSMYSLRTTNCPWKGRDPCHV